MTKTRYLVPLIFFIIVIAFLWNGLRHDLRKIPSPLIGKSLPIFQAKELQRPQQQITQQQLLGHVSLVNVWATWCMACRAEHPVLMDIARSGKVSIYGVNYKDNRDEALRWLQQYGNPYVHIIDDSKGLLGIDLGVYGAPETFLVDQKGIIRYKYIGPISPEAWQQDLLPKVEQLQNKG